VLTKVGPATRVGGGKDLVEACFTGTAPIVGMFAVGLMRAAFDAALTFARTERRGGAVPIIEYQAVGYALADAKTAIETVRTLSWRAAHAVDANTPGALELALHAKVFGSETAVRIITDLIRVVGVDSYDHDMPLGGLLADALVLPLFDGGNMGGAPAPTPRSHKGARLRPAGRGRVDAAARPHRRLCSQSEQSFSRLTSNGRH
jgi:nitroalkane oxidase